MRNWKVESFEMSRGTVKKIEDARMKGIHDFERSPRWGGPHYRVSCDIVSFYFCGFDWFEAKGKIVTDEFLGLLWKLYVCQWETKNKKKWSRFELNP